MKIFLTLFVLLFSSSVVAGDDLTGKKIFCVKKSIDSYYLLGFNHYRDYVFDDISWSTAFVYEETKSKIMKHNHTLYELPQWYDIDTLADYKKFKSKP